MAWPGNIDQTIFTTNGLGKKWMHALCLAVNERQDCLGITKTEFFKADSTQGSDLVLSDFAGIWTTQESPRFNLQTVQDAITDMLDAGYFTESSGISTAWTTANIEADIALGAFPASMEKFQDLDYLKRIKEALDRMIYARKPIPPSGGVRESISGSDSTSQLAWDEMYADTPASAPGFPGAGVSVSQTSLNGTSFSLFGLINSVDIVVDATSLEGTMTGTQFDISMTNTSAASGELDFTVGSASPYTISATGTALITGLTTDVSLGASISTLEMELVSLPTTTQFSDDAGSQLISASVQNVIAYYDISSELTDQA